MNYDLLIYPNRWSHYASLYENTFQHGGHIAGGDDSPAGHTHREVIGVQVLFLFTKS